MNDPRKWQSLIGLLEWACEHIELSETAAQTAAKRYGSVGQWLANGPEPSLADSTIYAQGSARLRTAIKPPKGDEFDIDLIVELPRSRGLLPSSVINIVGDRLKAHDEYKRMLSPIKRGWRLTYANDFHLDITPAIPDLARCGHCILVPDRKLTAWKESNPKGYAKWFDEIADLAVVGLTTQAALRADIEPLPEDVRFKGVLRRAVQLFKRHRDDLFARRLPEQEEHKPISIIITTLAARAYRFVVQTRPLSSELEMLLAVLRRMPDELRIDEYGYPRVANPMNHAENFAEKWKEERRKANAFFVWHRDALDAFGRLASAEGIDEIQAALAAIVGDDVSGFATAQYTHRLSKAREKRALQLGAGTGLVKAPAIVAATPAKSTFFGD
jgi:hypothetical protein